MKSITLIIVFFIALFSSVAFAQQPCAVSGPSGYNGPPTPALNVVCNGGVVSPPTCTPPEILDPTTNQCVTPVSYCDASQVSTPLSGKTFKRQCSGQYAIMPSTIGGNDALIDLGTVLGNSSFPAYKYAGYSPTFTIQSGYYVALAFKPAVSGAFQLVANTSYGDGGTISLSTTPGGLTRGAQGVICVQNFNASNSLFVSTSSGACRVTVGTTYYINFADTNINGDSLCYNDAPGACSQSTVSYTLYR